MPFIQLTAKGTPNSKIWINPARIARIDPRNLGSFIAIAGIDPHTLIVLESPEEIIRLIREPGNEKLD
jgi:hypothetical protein